MDGWMYIYRDIEIQRDIERYTVEIERERERERHDIEI